MNEYWDDPRGFGLGYLCRQCAEDVNPAGWYWWPCFPGCLPDGDPIGPFDTEAEALADARENAGHEE